MNRNTPVVFRSWMGREWPWDMANCRRCITMHALPKNDPCSCTRKDHADLVVAARKAKIQSNDDEDLRRNYSVALKLREKFARYWSDTKGEE